MEMGANATLEMPVKLPFDDQHAFLLTIDPSSYLTTDQNKGRKGKGYLKEASMLDQGQHCDTQSIHLGCR